MGAQRVNPFEVLLDNARVPRPHVNVLIFVDKQVTAVDKSPVDKI